MSKLFACLGDKRYLYDLQALLEEWGCSEETFIHAREARRFEELMLSLGKSQFEMSMIEAAACAFVVTMQSYAANGISFNASRLSDKSHNQAYFKRIRELDLFYPVLEGVQVTHGGCLEFLDILCDRSDAFCYIDPPYLPSEMVLSNHYGSRSWKLADHEELVDRLLLTKMKIAVSGYDNSCYSRLERSGWHKLFLKNVFVSSSAAAGRWHSEYLWLNFKIPSSLEGFVSKVDYSAL